MGLNAKHSCREKSGRAFMKKILIFALLMYCIGTFTACGKETPQTTGAPETVEDKMLR